MKSYTQPELRTFVERELQSLLGAQLQEIVANDRGLALGFYDRGTRWLVLDLTPGTPLALVVDRCPFPKGKSKPLGLFLASHGRNAVVRSLEVREDLGRVFVMSLSGRETACEIEVHLIPKAANVIVRAGDKQIAWAKPKTLAAPSAPAEFPAERPMESVRDEWLARQTGGAKPAADPEAQWRQRREKDLAKKSKALTELEAVLQADEAADWAARGDTLKTAGDFAGMDEAYAKSKQARAKRQGTAERADILRGEIAALQAQTFETARLTKRAPKPGGDLWKKAQAKGRTLHLEGGATVFMGKSAADNLALLRKARGWDYWLHLRDYPGAHAIVHRDRDQSIAEADLRKAAQWLAREALGSKVSGGRLAVVLAECRFVRPIKGDRLGRVNYHSERHFVVEVAAAT